MIATTTITVTSAELHARLDELLAAARSGAEVFIRDADQPGVRLSPTPAAEGLARREIVFDLHAGGFIADDFAAPLPDDFWGPSE